MPLTLLQIQPSEILATILTLAFACLIWVAIWVMRNPDIVAKGQDAAGKGMATGCLGILIFAGGAVVALFDAGIVVVRWHEMGWFARIIGLLPALFGVISLIAIAVTIRIARARREAANFAERMAVPASLIVDIDDSRMCRLYDALRPHFPELEITLRQPGALYWQQAEWYPRLGLLMMDAEALAERSTDDAPLPRADCNAQLLDDMANTTPMCPILLHALSTDVAERIAQSLRKAGWQVEILIADAAGNDWIAARWLPRAIELLTQGLAARDKARGPTSPA